MINTVKQKTTLLGGFTCDTYGQKRSRLTSPIARDTPCFFLFSARFICHRQREPANQLTAATVN